jgi:hypothetical protein
MLKSGSLLLVLAVAVAGCNSGGENRAGGPPPSAPAASAASETLNPADFSTNITNPLFPLSSLRTIEFSGTQRDPDGGTVKTRAVKQRLEKTDTIAGVTVAVLEVKEYEDDQLVEQTEDYFAQHRDGSVWYFGERVNDYEDGKLVGHEGQWLAGEGNSKPGLYMPANPTVGQEFEQERAPGVAEDRSKVVELNVDVTVPAGKFTGCMKTEDFAPLDNVKEFKHYCPRAGLVREQSASGSALNELVRFA